MSNVPLNVILKVSSSTNVFPIVLLESEVLYSFRITLNTPFNEEKAGINLPTPYNLPLTNEEYYKVFVQSVVLSSVVVSGVSPMKNTTKFSFKSL